MSFDDALAFVLRWEGGFVDDPADRGGATNKGITQAVYDEWRERKHYDKRSVRDIEDGEVKQIYLEQYWKPARCQALDSPMSLILFDSAVNHGVGRAVKLLQEVLNVAVDGHFGPATMAAYDFLEECHGTGHIATQYIKAREAFYFRIVEKDPTQGKFLRGWLNRLDWLRKEAKL